VPPRSPVSGPQARTSTPGSGTLDKPVWMGKLGSGKSGARVSASDAAAVERLKRAGYSRLDQGAPSAEENRVFDGDARDAGPLGAGPALGSEEGLSLGDYVQELSVPQYRGFLGVLARRAREAAQRREEDSGG
jgi:hypothetical protein